MNGNKNYTRIEGNPEFISFSEDVSKICAALPEVPMRKIFAGLMKLPRRNRVNVYLQNHFKNYAINDVQRNSINADVKIIQKILPDYPRESIMIDLLKVQNKQYRVQYVLKKYYENENCKLKRPVECTYVNMSPDKKIKLSEQVIDLEDEDISSNLQKNAINSNTIENNSNKLICTDTDQQKNRPCVLNVLKELFPDYKDDELFRICNDYGYKTSDIISKGELNMLINQIICSKSDSTSECIAQTCNDPQPSTSFYGLEQVPKTINSVSSSQTSNSTEEYDISDYNHLDFLNLNIKENKSLENFQGSELVDYNLQEQKNKATIFPVSSSTNVLNVVREKVGITLKEHEEYLRIKKEPEIEEPNSTSNELMNLHLNDIVQKLQHLSNATQNVEDLDATFRNDLFDKQEESCLKFSFETNLTDYEWSNTDKFNDRVDNYINETTVNIDTNYNNLEDVVETQIGQIDSSVTNKRTNEFIKINDFVANSAKLDLDFNNLLAKTKEKLKKITNHVDYIDLCQDSDKDSLQSIDTIEVIRDIESPEGTTTDTITNEIVAPEPDPVIENNAGVEINIDNNLSAEHQNKLNKIDMGLEANIAGPSHRNDAPKHAFYHTLMEMFPDICPEYLTEFCSKLADSKPATFDWSISCLLSTDYNRRERVESPGITLDPDEQMHMLQDLFPDADPTYLEYNCEKLINDPEKFRNFVSETLEHKNYPTREEYMRKLKLTTQEKKYTTEFSVENFLEVIPDPVAYFSKPNRPRACDIFHPNYFKYDTYIMTFFKNHYNHIAIRDMTNIISANYTLIQTAEKIENLKKSMKSRRKAVPLPSCDNIPLLQELAFIKHKAEILDYIEKQKIEKEEARQLAKAMGQMKTCECCFDDEVMLDDVVCCDNGHEFCKDCVRRGAEVEIGNGKLDFPCLQDCGVKFSLQTLQLVLKPSVFSRMVQRKQLEEIKSAGIEDLAMCPFCDFATIPAPGDKLFRCLNEECMKESCLSCREPSHIPLRCDEVEKDNDVKLRTYIEDKMTEALIRKCHKCGMKFIKADGCNKMTCSCGAMMCYVCQQPVTDYKHFNGQGGDKLHLCPLYSDTVQLHAESVKKSAEMAKAELGVNKDKLKIDPTEGLEKHYKEVKKRNPHNEVHIYPNIIHVPHHNHHHNHNDHHHNHHHGNHQHH